MRKLFLDDQRPAPLGWELVRSYTEFVDSITKLGVPDVIAFDHDLGFEHYPLMEQNPGDKIPYDSYKEKTGYHCAKWLVEQGSALPRVVVVHSFNTVGAQNIARHFLRYTDAEVIIFPYKLPFIDFKENGSDGNRPKSR
jgi:hypothetical protein